MFNYFNKVKYTWREITTKLVWGMPEVCWASFCSFIVSPAILIPDLVFFSRKTGSEIWRRELTRAVMSKGMATMLKVRIYSSFFLPIRLLVDSILAVWTWAWSWLAVCTCGLYRMGVIVVIGIFHRLTPSQFLPFVMPDLACIRIFINTPSLSPGLSICPYISISKTLT